MCIKYYKYAYDGMYKNKLIFLFVAVQPLTGDYLIYLDINRTPLKSDQPVARPLPVQESTRRTFMH